MQLRVFEKMYAAKNNLRGFVSVKISSANGSNHLFFSSSSIKHSSSWLGSITSEGISDFNVGAALIILCISDVHLRIDLGGALPGIHWLIWQGTYSDQ